MSILWTPSGSYPLCLTPPCYDLEPPRMAAPFLVPSTSAALIACRKPSRKDSAIAAGHERRAGACFCRGEAPDMSDRMIDRLQPVSFGERLAASQNFSRLFRDGMKLVEDTAAYLDGPGRQESKLLDRAASLAYATESMRLTTRLMQLASWLLLHRAVNEDR